MLYSTNNVTVAKHFWCLPISPGHYYLQVSTPAHSLWLFPNKTFKNWGTNKPPFPLCPPPSSGEAIDQWLHSSQCLNSFPIREVILGCVFYTFPRVSLLLLRSSHIWFIGSPPCTVPWSHCHCEGIGVLVSGCTSERTKTETETE